MDDFKSSHPAALSFSEPMILQISFSVTGSKIKGINYILLYIINRIFISRCYRISQNSANIYKKKYWICLR